MPKAPVYRVNADITEMSVVEILTYLDLGFCGAQKEYFKYGNDLRAMWEALISNEDHWARVRGHLDIATAEDAFPDELVEAMLPFFCPKEIKAENLHALLSDHFSEEWLKDAYKSEEGKADYRYQLFLDKLQVKMHARLTDRDIPFKKAAPKKRNEQSKKANDTKGAKRSSK